MERQHQVPLRLYTRLFRPGKAWRVHLVSGVTMQALPWTRRGVAGDFQTESGANYYPLIVSRREQPDRRYVVEVTEQHPTNWLFENGLILSYVPLPRFTVDFAAVYQSGLKTQQTLKVSTVSTPTAPITSIAYASNRGSGLVLALTSRYALRGWNT